MTHGPNPMDETIRVTMALETMINMTVALVHGGYGPKAVAGGGGHRVASPQRPEDRTQAPAELNGR